jgi:hypothetical protein
MKKTLFSVLFFLILASLILSLPIARKHSTSGFVAVETTDAIPQSVKKPKYDYMSSILSRNTKPLGLKDNLPLRRFLNQPSIKWAVRSGSRHILN